MTRRAGRGREIVQETILGEIFASNPAGDWS